MPAIRHQVNIDAAQRSVWDALTTAEGITQWWADDARIDGRKGGRLVIVTEGDDGEPIEDRAIIHTWRPTSRLEYAFDTIGSSVTKGQRVAFSLARDGSETRLALVLSGGDALEDEEIRAGLKKEWVSALRALQRALDAS